MGAEPGCSHQDDAGVYCSEWGGCEGVRGEGVRWWKCMIICDTRPT